jgi:broad-specificity NMP kinase
MRIAVVGTCASGKSSVVAALRALGYDAYAVAQEHSAIPRLWAHLDPDCVVYLTVSLDTLRARRADDAWPEWIYRTQLERLESARKHSDIVISTDAVSVTDVAATILRSLPTS